VGSQSAATIDALHLESLLVLLLGPSFIGRPNFIACSKKLCVMDAEGAWPATIRRILGTQIIKRLLNAIIDCKMTTPT
jgi:hypothetical protein